MSITISNGPYSAVIAPDAGGAVMALRFDGRDILRPAPSVDAVKTDPREAACYPCVPWFGRLYGGLDFGGRHYDLAPTLPACDPDHALHGHGWLNIWETVRQEQNRIDCRFDYQPREKAFPFPFRAEQSFRMDGGFEIVLSVINTGITPMPAGLGLHPFFPNGDFTALNVVEICGQQKSPGALRSPATVDHSGPIPEDAIDCTLRGWNGHAEILHDGMRMEMRSNARILHLYSPENADFFCAEPVSHRPGHFGHDILAPGETIDLKLQLYIKD